MNGVYSDNSIEKLFNNDEYQLYGNNNSNSPTIVINQQRMYCNAMSEFPLLTQDEEKRYFNMLTNLSDKKLLISKEHGNIKVSNLNIPLLFFSLENNKSYEMIITSVIEFFSKLDSDNSTIIMVLKKYLKKAKELNRALNKNEIINIFHIKEINNTLKEKELLDEIKKFMNYKFAYEKILLSNLRLVVSIVNKYRNIGNNSPMDLINVGNISLMKAIQKFDVSYDCRFASYAANWITTDITRAIMSNQGSVKLPIYIAEDLYKFKQDLAKLEKKEQRVLTKSEVASKLNIPSDLINLFYSYIAGDVYLDCAVSDSDDREVKDTIADIRDIEDDVLQNNLKEDINILFTNLNDREKEVIKMYYGLGEYKDNALSIIDISKLYHLDRQRIYQIRNSAIVKMKAYARNVGKAKELKEYVR